jgi:histidine triad (HIT) family protein
MSDCLFCKIAKKEIPSTLELENESVIAFRDINPQAPTHILVVPKKHISRISEVASEDRALIGDLVLYAKEIAMQNDLEEGYRLVFNNGPEAGQTVFHIHLHVLGGRRMKWPPG